MKYAENTSVSVERSKAEIESLLQRYGADQFISGWNGNDAHIGFRMLNRMVKFEIKLPDKEKFKKTPTGRYRRDRDLQIKSWEQACRQRWRSLLLRIKAKLEAIENGDAEFDYEFMANIVLPDRRTIGEFMAPQIKAAYEAGKMPAMIPWFEEK
jgi:hypothetical protein